MVPGILLLAALLNAAARPGVPADTVGDGARRYVREAMLAVERDSAPPLVARWSARLGPDSADRATLLGLATAARLTNDDTTAMRLYLRLIRSPASGGDAYTTYAHLGLARLYFDRADLPAADTAARAALAGARGRHDHAAEGEALLSVANARMDQDARAGRAYLDSALRALPATETDLAAEVRCRRARLGFRSGDPGFPRELSAALAFARRAGAHRAEAQCLRTAAVDLFTRGLDRLGDRAAAALRRAAARGSGAARARLYPHHAGRRAPRPRRVRRGQGGARASRSTRRARRATGGRGAGEAHARHPRTTRCTTSPRHRAGSTRRSRSTSPWTTRPTR